MILPSVTSEQDATIQAKASAAAAGESKNFAALSLSVRIRVISFTWDAVSSLQVVLLHVVAERAEAHPEELGRFHLHAPGTHQRLRDVFLLEAFNVLFEIEPVLR